MVSMSEAHHEQDLNEEAAGVVRIATGAGDALPPELGAAWESWSKCIHGVDERTWTLLKAAFEAGAESVKKD
jgi:hypothetical protein